jgi:hypothetical protein
MLLFFHTTLPLPKPKSVTLALRAREHDLEGPPGKKDFFCDYPLYFFILTGVRWLKPASGPASSARREASG